MNYFSNQELLTQIRQGDLRSLSRAITLAESKKEEHQAQAQELIQQLMPYSGQSKRIAITGVPGAGKSTFIESLGLFLVKKGHKVAVLAIDPSSSISGGSILGDKTRMEELSKSSNAFIRPSATGGDLGGISSRTYEGMILCEAAGFDVILIETVGVGQSETLVNEITDLFLFLQVSGTGDDLQGIKRGIMEMADIIFINKTDLVDSKLINETKMDLHRSLQFLPQKNSGFKRKVLKGSGLSNQGIGEVWDVITQYFDEIETNGFLEINRNQQKLQRVEHYAKEILIRKFLNLEKELKDESISSSLAENKISPYEVAQQMISKINWKSED